MLSRLGRNLRSFIWALILGLSVWVAAVTAADPDEVRALPTPVRIEVLGQDPALVITSAVPENVRVTLRAPQSVWSQLSADPESVHANLNVSGLAAGEHRVNVQIQIDARPVRVISVSPASVPVVLEPLASRTLTLQSTISGQPAIGYQAGDLALDPSQIVISGPSSRVDQVNRVRVLINVGGIRESIDQDIPVEALDQNNAPIAGLTLQPQATHVSLPVVRQGGFRDMAVKVVVRGQVAAGYRLDSIAVFPPVVTIYSDNPELVNGLPGVVETQPLDLKAANNNLSLRVSLDLPEGVSVVGQQTVLIQAGISPVQSSFTLAGQKVEVSGLAEGMDAQISPASVDVIVSGPIPILDTLRRQDVHVTVDVAKLAPGSYQLTPNVQILASGVTTESLLPGTVEVVLAPKVLDTPRP